MSKVAVCFYGHPRDVESYVQSLEDCIIKPNNADVFVHTWKSDTVDVLLSKLKPKSYIVEDNDVFMAEHAEKLEVIRKLPANYNQSWSEKVYSKMYSVYKSFQLSEGYDDVFMVRTQVTYSGPLVSDSEYLVIPCGADYGGFMDNFAFGPRNKVEYYCNLWTKMDDFIRDDIGFHPGRMLRYNIVNLHNEPVKRIEYPIFLRGSIWNFLNDRDPRNFIDKEPLREDYVHDTKW